MVETEESNDASLAPVGGGGSADTGHGDMDPGGTARELLNQYLRPNDFQGGRAALSQEGWQYLTSPRSLPANSGLSTERGERLALNPFVDSSGGWVQAEEISNEILTIRDRATGLEAAVTTRDIMGTRLAIPTMQVKVTFTKRSKATLATQDTLDMEKIIGRTALTVHPKDAVLLIPIQLFEEPAFDAVGEIARAAERDSREDDETDIIVGTGSGEPLGLVPTVTKLFTEGAYKTFQ